ncbi:VOC family protein [Elizabethkingia anophelis]|uniref:Glyoxalase n=1 Tax=Elizabethkingia anophelis TaxID=1117645 RepID=A0AAU8VHR7_9FLAO|nr:VOC family protein [Elizabethkingia anophelis]AQX02820.1 glyoxalase [Elizabethkingia anophelis]MCT3759275.1 VOC family protein [Elizabethkingia anophelis]MCT3897816.1 VOC family protein [Elizabethkingia anophelis]MCT3905391.1 VOC family protein [Elizabethkingia anophelis]MCT3974085.1 VOC family protein [Elizabethkingia anophelis]
MIKFGYTIFYVKNVTKSIEFYEKSFGFERKFITPENDYGELNTGETSIAFASLELANTNLADGFTPGNLNDKPFATEIGLITDKPENTVQQSLQYGATLVQEPLQKPWGQTVAYIRDIDGFLIEICSPML